MPVTLIDTFRVPADQEEEFLERWTETTKIYARTAGFIETHLHRNTGVGNQTFQFINIALWASSRGWFESRVERRAASDRKGDTANG